MYRIKQLSQEANKLFHTQDLALLWEINNSNTLYTQIKRYVSQGILYRIHKGYYASISLSNIDPVLLGIGYLHDYAYLSGESVLKEAGIVFQQSPYITLISSVSRKFTIGSNQYLVRRLKPELLYNPTGLFKKGSYLQATPERAVADLLYYSKKRYFDNPLINWKAVEKIQKEMNNK